MAKVLTQDDINKKNARAFIDKFNQLIKPLSSMCYIDYDGICYLKSESTKIERFAAMDFADPVKQLMQGALYDTQELAEFRKSYRYSKSSVVLGYSENPNDAKVCLRTENPDNKDDILEFEILCVCGNTYDEEEKIFGRDKIANEFYKKFYQMVDFITMRRNMSSESYSKPLSSDQLDALVNGDMIEVTDKSMGKDIHAYITKEIFPNIKKVSEIRYFTMPDRSSDDDQIAYMVFVERLENYNGDGNDLRIFSLISVYQSI